MSKTTCEETKTEEQVTTKTSHIVTMPPESKGEEVSQDSQDIPTQQVVTAIVHQEESADQGSHEVTNVEFGNQEHKEGEDKNDDSKENEGVKLGETEEATIETKLSHDDSTDPVRGEEDYGEKERNIDDKTPDDAGFWEGGDEDNTPREKGDESIRKGDSKENVVAHTEDKSTIDENQQADGVHEEKEHSKGNGEETDDVKNKDNDCDESKETAEKVKSLEETELGKGDESTLGNPTDAEDGLVEQNRDKSEDEIESNELPRKDSRSENDKGLIKVLGRTEIDETSLKGVLKVEKISSEVLKEKSRDREKDKVRERRRKSSFEIVSPARSLPDVDLDSETPRSLSRTGADSSQLPDSGFEPSPRRDSKSELKVFKVANKNRIWCSLIKFTFYYIQGVLELVLTIFW